MIKILCFLLLGVSSIVGCSPKGYKINGRIEDTDRATIKLLVTNEDGKLETLQSVVTDDGSFEFSCVMQESHLCFLTVSNKFGRIPLMLENADYKITIGEANENRADNYVVESTSQLQNIRSEFQKQQKVFFQKSDSLVTLYDGAKKIVDLIEASIIYRQLDTLSMKYNELTLECIKSNADNLVGLSLIYDPLMQLKYSVLKSRYELLCDNMKNTVEGKACLQRLKYLCGLVVGGTFRDFKMPTVQGDTFQLSQLNAKVKLIDFWASWCGPCRKENPNLLRIYQKYKDKGLEIIGISLDTDREAWLKAVSDDKLPWTQISDLKGIYGDIAKKYSIRAIPQMFILDEHNKIVALNLRGERIEAAIRDVLE